MKKTVIKWNMLRLLALLCAALFCAGGACAQELRVGNLIYVPAMGASSGAGAISLTVEGLTLPQDSDEPQIVSPLAGAEFGVYVISSAGELTAWANPLYPSEPMRVRTGEGETLFLLPQGMEFYLRQESAPQGYLFDADALIPVDGDSLVVRNAMAGQIAVSVADELGHPIAGVELTAVAPDGSAQTAVTGEDGEASFACEDAGVYTVSESALPQGVFAVQDGETAVRIEAQLSARRRVRFEHPAAGEVRLTALFSALGEDGEAKLEPLPGLRLDVLGDAPQSIVTDEDGVASVRLLEGTYDVRMRYEGERDALLPAEDGVVIVQKGQETAVELTATERTGRIAVQAEAARAVESGSVTFEDEQGRSYGPYAFDADGLIVTGPLPAGAYRVSAFEAPNEMELGAVSADGASADGWDGLTLDVRAGALTRVTAQLLTWESQTYDLLTLSLDDEGKQAYDALMQRMELQVLDASGACVGSVEALDGRVRLSGLLSGEYRLCMDERTARSLGLSAVSRAFALPSEEDAVVFASDSARLILYSVDENGMSVPGARYRVTDGAGRASDVSTDESGEAVTGPLAPGEITVECVESPAEHDAAQTAVLQAQAGDALSVNMAHESYGEAQVDVSALRLDELGGESYGALSGVRIRLYRVEGDGASMTDTGVSLVSDADGRASMRLAPGEYVAQADASTLEAGVQPPQAARFAVANGESVQVELVCPDAFGGVRATLYGGELSDDQLAQVQFELIASDGTSAALAPQDGAFYVGGLPAGTYVLRQTRMPQGYSLASERTVSVQGGAVAQVGVPLEEYAVVTVNKTGLTFNDQLQTFVVPLTGEYGVYTMADGEMRAYPSEDAQATVWSNVTPEQEAQGMLASVRLPAAIEGTTYYLRELGDARGFASDVDYHEVTLYAGGAEQIECAVSSDRGFFSVEMLDAFGAHVRGGAFEVLDANGEHVLDFEMGDEAYQNPMAVPVGAYVLRQLRAAEGYTLAAQPEMEIDVEPYLTRGGAVARVEMTCARIPQDGSLALIGDLYAAREQGITMVGMDGGALDKGETLRRPELLLRLSAAGGERVDAISVVLSSPSDERGGQYAARVEYCLSAGGWQPGDARMTGILDAPEAVSLADIEDDVCAVRVTYIDAQSGLEAAGEGFAPGSVTVSLRVGAGQRARVTAEAEFGGDFVYVTELDGASRTLALDQRAEIEFEAEGDGLFATPVAGRDGRVSGVAFFDENADGLLEADETARASGLSVSLLNAGGDVIETRRTDADGRYAFTGISAGTYALEFESEGGLIFSRGEGYSQHIVSGVLDARYGTSGPFTVDGENTDFVVNAGCVNAARVIGQILKLDETGETSGFGGLNVELRALAAESHEEPSVVMTGETGEFAFTGLMPGRYEAALALPDGILCRDAQDGVIAAEFELSQGETATFGLPCLQRAASVGGSVRIDDDGDGVLAPDAAGLADAEVALLLVQDGHAEEIARTRTAQDGAYRFDGLYEGEYGVLFELSGDWSFTRCGEDSLVDSGMSQTGGTPTFALGVGENKEGVNAGVTIPAQLTVSVFEDTQRDGQYNGREAMLEGASVSLVRLEDGEPAEEVTYRTDASGSVVFASVSPGEYRLRYQLPGAWRATVQAAQGEYPVSCVPQSTLSAGESDAFTLTMGQTGVRLYIGATLTGSISGTVYYDDDADAVRGENEGPVRGERVELLDIEGATLYERQTEEDGSYAFEGLAPGRYRVRFTSEEDSAFSASERSMSRGGVQESDGPVSATRVITVRAGESTPSADAGVVRLGTIEGAVWEDRNADRAMDGAEAAFAGVSVQLMNGAGRTILQSTVTDNLGMYRFERVYPGEYVIRVDAPERYVFSGALSGGALPLGEERDGRGYSAAFMLLGGAHVQNATFGLLSLGSIGGRIWQDDNYDGVMSEGEEGLRDAAVTLLGADGRVVGSVQTGRSGEYSFGELMPGEYAVNVTLPEGYVYTAVGGDSRAPRQDEPQATVPAGTLEMGAAIGGVNIGALTPASVGGVVWLDEDDDGRRQAQDAGVQSARVRLTMLSGADAGRSFETTADVTGAYRIDGVMPGQAQLSVELGNGYAFAKQIGGTRRVSVMPQADALTANSAAFDVTAGAQLTAMDVGVVGVGVISGVVWQDGAYDGARGVDEPGVRGAIVTLIDAATGQRIREAETGDDGAYVLDFVRLGAYELEIALPDGMIFTCDGESAVANIDASVARTPVSIETMGESRTGLNAGAILPASLRGRVAVDENEDGVPAPDEGGLSDAVITVMQGGTAVATARTDADGEYAFDLLRPGEYRVRIALGQNALFASGAALTLPDADAQEGETEPVALSMGEARALEPVAAVLAGRITGRAWSDTDADGEMDAQEPVLWGVTAELLALNGGDAQTPVASAQVGGDGRYAFELLRSGAYAVRFTLPDGMLLTDRRDVPEGSSVTVVPGSVGTTDTLLLAMGQEIAGVNVGGILPGEIGDTIWTDVNANGLQDYREPLEPGVGVTLLRVLDDGTTEEASHTISDEYGYYHFRSLRPGRYVVALDTQRALTQRFGAPLGEIDSDLDPQTGMSDVISLLSGQTLLNVDVGLLAQ